MITKEQAKLLKRLKRRKPWQPIIISDNLSWKEFSRLNVYLHEIYQDYLIQYTKKKTLLVLQGLKIYSR